MLRIVQNSDAAAAKGYYTSKAEYYAGQQQEQVGNWGGKSAERLDLFGEVDRHSFSRLCDNRHPVTGERLTARMRQDRRCGYDFNFHACKSASLLYGLTGDTAILTAFRRAVAATMRDIEAGVKVRVRKGGRYAERTAGNAVWAEYLHFTARPVSGVIDPHLHAHCFLLNCCFDPVEKIWKAVDVGSVKSDGERYQLAFQRRFAKELARLGYGVAWKGNAFEIDGIGRATIEKFSVRTRQVEEMAEKLGITDPKAKDKLGALTRERKQNDARMDALRREWWARLTDQERAALAVITAMRPVIGNASDRRVFDTLLSGFPFRHPDASELPPGWAERQCLARRHDLTLQRWQRHPAEADTAHMAYRPMPPPRHHPHGR